MALKDMNWKKYLPKNIPKNLAELRQYINDPKNRPLVLSVCGLSIALIFATVYGTAYLKTKSAPAGLSEQERNNAKTLDFLPKTERSSNASSEEDNDEPNPRDPFIGSMILKGVIVGGGGSNQAIIELSKTIFIVSPGMKIGDSWTIEDIWADGVRLKSVNKELTLNFSGRQVTEKKGTDETSDSKSKISGTTGASVNSTQKGVGSQ
ncbi:hypothetical protein GJ688_10380 [Heliobacillus mobilis]|uniref:Uncharacterized protein n=1 Tax=Heliobacterium mobile TaxID=28064 RepID=A0A6I3SKC4_HELMO|nr:hypothetical protein [Heliobacterium mobile]MTV49384.1 hypothetical protein [Heliobacterium mobile]